jgi:hypothetical protein
LIQAPSIDAAGRVLCYTGHGYWCSRWPGGTYPPQDSPYCDLKAQDAPRKSCCDAEFHARKLRDCGAPDISDAARNRENCAPRMDIPVARRTQQMIRPNRQSQRLIALFLLGCLMFNYPLMYVFSVDGRILGIPILFAYLFSAWAALIALIALVTEKREPAQRDSAGT